MGGPLEGLGPRDGMRVPLAGEAAWLLLEGRQIYWRGRLGKLRYRLSA